MHSVPEEQQEQRCEGNIHNPHSDYYTANNSRSISTGFATIATTFTDPLNLSFINIKDKQIEIQVGPKTSLNLFERGHRAVSDLYDKSISGAMTASTL